MRTFAHRGAIALLAALLALPAWSFDLQGHRGARGLAPENTLPAFARALELGVTTLELDVGLSADGVPVVAHDAFLHPQFTRDAQGRWLEGERGPLLKTLTVRELQAYDVGRIRPDSKYARTFAGQHPHDGTRIPTLAQVLALVAGRGAPVRLNIEIKSNPHRPQDTAPVESMVRAVLEVVQAAGMQERVTIQSFDWRNLQLVQRLAPAVPTAYLTIQTLRNDNVRDTDWTAGFALDAHGSVPRMVKAAGGRIWSPNAGALTEALVKEAQALGLQVIPWTVNEPPQMERLIGWGVDGLITDYPDRLRAVLQRQGLPLPAPAP